MTRLLQRSAFVTLRRVTLRYIVVFASSSAQSKRIPVGGVETMRSQLPPETRERSVCLRGARCACAVGRQHGQGVVYEHSKDAPKAPEAQANEGARS